MRTFFNFARSFLKPLSPVIQKRIVINSIYQRDLYLESRLPITKTSRFFSKTRQQTGNETDEENPLSIQEQTDKAFGISTQKEVEDLPQNVSQQLAQDIINIISSDYTSIYTKEDLRESPLYKLLFKEGIHQEEIITTPPQDRVVQGSIDKTEETLVFFPNSIFQQFFEKCDSLKKSQKVLITAQQGLGKTYAAALYVYLKRKIGNCRVFYIHNSQAFIDSPFLEFSNQTQVAFAKELENSEVKQAFEKLQNVILDDLNYTVEQKVIGIEIFLRVLVPYLKKEDINIYIIADQVNVFAKESSKHIAEVANFVLTKLNSVIKSARSIHIASLTYENIISQTQERPHHELMPPLELDESLKNYIRFLANDQTLSDDIIRNITRVTGCIPLEARLFFQFIDHKWMISEGLSVYKHIRTSWIQTILKDFLEQDGSRHKNMTLALEGLMNEGIYNSTMDKIKIDQRFFFVDMVKRRIFALLPIAKEALQNCILEPDIIDKAIHAVQNIPSTIGFLLEQEIHKVAVVWLRSGNFIAQNTQNKRKQEKFSVIDSNTKVEDFGEGFLSNIFDVLNHKGYHKFHNRFPAFDGILVQDHKITLIQIKRMLGSEIVNMLKFFKNTIDNFVDSPNRECTFTSIKNNPTAQGGVKKEEIIEFLLSKAIEEKKSLEIVFITKKTPLKHLYCRQIVAEGNKTLTIRFLELDPMEALVHAQLLSSSREILYNRYKL